MEEVLWVNKLVENYMKKGWNTVEMEVGGRVTIG